MNGNGAPRASDIPSVYNPKDVEQRLYQDWLDGGYFHGDVRPGKEPFAIVIPPPNVTGSLHVGHVVPMTLQDIIIRYRRKQGYEALWIPGTDHAGIATQNVVEKELAREGLSRHDLGREAFLERVWAWKEQYGGRIIDQLKRLGASCDWRRTRFTMDEGCSRAVREVFVRLYEKGLIYRGDYIINWCPRCRTALSDIEVEHEETAGHLHFVRYPFADGSGYITVATTRPETILGDTAVAVHPDDDRYRDAVGKEVIIPIVDRRVPVIADGYVDPSFGTGAVKVTPAHDPNDFEMGRRHNLPAVAVIGEDGRMTAEATTRYQGMDRYECRKALLLDLDSGGYLVKVEEHGHALGHCQRCATVVEPLISRQWFVKMKPLASPAIQAVEEGRTRFIPERFTRVYINWLENIRDWCISRQLWWGHRIPAWYCQDCGETIVASRDPSSCSRCGGTRLEQDPDVLDTWFSSALWPFSTMGWPERTPELAYFYPTAALVTGYDIIFFWVARMIFMGLEFMGDVPFRDVFINGLVRDAEGKKMSKSRGNTIDPLEVIDEFGADTLRFAVVVGNAPGNDIRLYREKLEGIRNFGNKIWNASRFVILNLEGFDPAGRDLSTLDLGLADRWILGRFNALVDDVGRMMEDYDFGGVGKAIYDFLWSEYCDWYIEMVKPRLYSVVDPQARDAAQYVLWYVLEGVMHLLHPFMPFISEEIWQRLPHSGRSLAVTPWPRARADLAYTAEAERMDLIMDIVRAIRNIRAEMNVVPSRKAEVVLQAGPDVLEGVLKPGAAYISHLGNASELRLEQVNGRKPARAAASIVGGVEVYVPLAGLIDIDREIERLQKELEGARREMARVDGKLANPNFVEKAPPEVVAREKERRAEYEQKVAKIEERLAALR